jgi:hypothetical protein
VFVYRSWWVHNAYDTGTRSVMTQETQPDRTHTPPPSPPDPREDHREYSESSDDKRVTLDKRVWSPAQLVAAALGLFLIVLGAVSLLRSGVETLTSPTATVLGFSQTPLMALISIVMGALFLRAAASTLGVRGSLTFLGLLSLGFGLIVAIEPGATATWFGGTRSLGLLYLAIGAASLVAGWASPTIVQERTSTRQGHDRLESDERIVDTDERA